MIYVSQPQIWNKYVYSLNRPLRLTDPDGRRPITEAEKANIEKFKQSRYAYSQEKVANGEWTREQAEQFRYSVDAASHAIENAILAVPAGQSDPMNLRVVLWSINAIGDTRYSANSKNGGADLVYSTNGWKIWAAKDNVKCNFFVAMAYINKDGGNIGLKTSSNTGGFENSTSLKWTLLSRGQWANIPTAQQMSGTGISNFTKSSSSQFGYIVAGPSGNSFHAGIVISGPVVVSANDYSGVRVGSFSGTYLRYKP